MKKMLGVLYRWDDLEGNIEWRDHIPSSWLQDEGVFADRRHLCFRRGKQKLDLSCEVTVAGRLVSIAYDGRDLRGVNRFSPGISLIRFEDDERTRPIEQVEWQEPGGYRYLEAGKIVTDFIFSSTEGAAIVTSHKKRERDSRLIEAKKNEVFAEAGKFVCEACDFDFTEGYGELNVLYCEVHHDDFLHHGERETTLDDLSILCANCHRVIHWCAGRGEI